MLPQLFEERMKRLLGEEYGAFLEGYEKEHVAGLRLNRLKLTGREWEALSPFIRKPIPWIDNGYYIPVSGQEGEERMAAPTKHPYYYAGLYYIQEPSAMTPANLLPVEPGDRVLDLCAAPGGKSTELAAKLAGKGVLVSNDISSTRAKALLKNLGVFGVRNAVIMSEPPNTLAKVFPGYFDRILVDAPCSGEGMFRKDPSIQKNWEQYGVAYYHKLQKEIILAAAQMLRPGGLLLYSTCTFSPEENEGTVAWLLSQCPEFTIQEIPDRYEGFGEGRPDWITLPEELTEKADSFRHCVRIWPHRMGGEGHFCALLKKGGEEEKEAEKKVEKLPVSFRPAKLEMAEREFLQEAGFREEELEQVYLQGDKLFLRPEYLPDLKGLRLLRNGLYLGDRKKNRFEPSQPLAMALTKEQAADFYDLSASDPLVIKYLKCETLMLSGQETEAFTKNARKEKAEKEERRQAGGLTLVGVDGFPLGWGKRNGGSIKNKYFSGWRML